MERRYCKNSSLTKFISIQFDVGTKRERWATAGSAYSKKIKLIIHSKKKFNWTTITPTKRKKQKLYNGTRNSWVAGEQEQEIWWWHDKKKLNSATKQPQNGHGVSHFRNNQKYYMITSTKQKEIAKLNMLLLIERQKKVVQRKKNDHCSNKKQKIKANQPIWNIARDDVNHHAQRNKPDRTHAWEMRKDDTCKWGGRLTGGRNIPITTTIRKKRPKRRTNGSTQVNK